MEQVNECPGIDNVEAFRDQRDSHEICLNNERVLGSSPTSAVGGDFLRKEKERSERLNHFIRS